jgi:hypothetical protein
MVRIIRNLVMKVKYITPWILRAFWVMVQVMVLAAASLWLGTPRVVDRIAGSLVAEAVGKNLPENLDTILYWIACGVAVVEIVMSWILLSYLTMFVLGLLF